MATVQQKETPIVTTENRGNDKFTKIALIILAVVLVVIISEVAYFIFAKNDSSFLSLHKLTQVEESERTTDISAPSPTPSPTPYREIVIASDKARVFADTLDSLWANYALGPSDTATINIEVSGIVKVADFDQKETDGVNYTYMFQIQRQTGGMIVYRLTDEEIANAEISLSSSSNKGEISITNIKPGDILIIKQTINLLDDSPHSSLILEVQR